MRVQSSRERRGWRVAHQAEVRESEPSSAAPGRCARLARERADAHEREARAMRAAQVPFDRLRRRGRDDDRLLQQRLHAHAARLGRGMHPAEVADAMLSGRRHVLQVTPQELLGGERATLPLLRGRVGVVEAIKRRQVLTLDNYHRAARSGNVRCTLILLGLPAGPVLPKGRSVHMGGADAESGV